MKKTVLLLFVATNYISAQTIPPLITEGTLLEDQSIVNPLPASGKTWFVNAGATGNGSSWSNAWGDLSNINWNMITAGDEVCIAGGSYSKNLVTGADGASGNPIIVKRASASDSRCGSGSAGWNAAYDAQVVMNGSITLQNNYITIDGMVWNGIKMIMQNPGGGSNYVAIGENSATNAITLRNIEITGPCGTTACAQNGDQRSIELEHWNGSDWATMNNWLIQYVNLHGACNNMVIYGATNMVVEHSRFADAATTNTTNCHPNIVNAGSNSNITWRYNEMVNWQVEGIMLLGGNSGWNIYGNIWHDPMPGSYPRVIEAQNGAEGPVLMYNNTFVNLYYLNSSTSNGGTFAAGSKGRNNIYWNDNATPSGLPSDDYDYSDAALNEANGEGNASDPFVNISAQDYHLSSATSAGLTLASPFDMDYDGNTRATDGVWDRGAYEYKASTGIQNNSTPDQLIRIFPNTASDKIYFLTNASALKIFNITLCDVQGKQVISKSINAQTEKSMDVSSLAPGMYFVQLTNESINANYKIVIIK